MGDRKGDVRQRRSHRGDGRVALCGQFASTFFGHARRLAEQMEQDELLDDRGAEINGDACVDQSGQLALRSSDPSQAEAAPVRLARRADHDGVAVMGAEGECPVARIEPDLGDRLVDEGQRARPLEGVRHFGALVIGHEGAGRVVEVGHEHRSLGGRGSERGDHR